MRKICPKCGVNTQDNQSIFCNRCGTKLPDDVTEKNSNFCSSCGEKILNNESTFCHKCGSRLNVTQKIPPLPIPPLIKKHPEIKYYKNPAYDKKINRPDPGVFVKLVFLGISTLIIYVVCDTISTAFILYGNSINQLSVFSSSPDIVNHFGYIYISIGWIIKILPFVALIILGVLVFYKPETIQESP